LIQNGILHKIDDNNGRIAISEDILDDELSFLKEDQKHKILPILQQSPLSFFHSNLSFF